MKEINNLEDILLTEDATEMALSIAKEELLKELGKKNDEQIRKEEDLKIKKRLFKELVSINIAVMGVAAAGVILASGPAALAILVFGLAETLFVSQAIKEYKVESENLNKTLNKYDDKTTDENIKFLREVIASSEKKLNHEIKSQNILLSENKKINTPNLTSMNEETKTYTKKK